MMGSGSKSQVRVPFPGFGSGLGTKKVGFSSGFVFPNTSLLMGLGSKSQVRVPFLGFGSGSGLVRVANKLGVSPGFPVFGYPNPSLAYPSIIIRTNLFCRSAAIN